MLAAFLAVFIYSLMDTGIYFEQLRAPLRAGEGEELWKPKSRDKGMQVAACSGGLRRCGDVLSSICIGRKKTMARHGHMRIVGVLSSAACTGLFGYSGRCLGKKGVFKGQENPQKGKSNSVVFHFLQRRSRTALFVHLGGFYAL